MKKVTFTLLLILAALLSSCSDEKHITKDYYLFSNDNGVRSIYCKVGDSLYKNLLWYKVISVENGGGFLLGRLVVSGFEKDFVIFIEDNKSCMNSKVVTYETEKEFISKSKAEKISDDIVMSVLASINQDS
ncbi:hypothetical protein [Spartinivicinus ruber]|uniref:hypothetical protein n=1 Tax=Spartinivicinus ruber TaxID=2683272 RepID=UPI0013D593EB|nr:hypothetical protein [Spartinivicinus ruber]